MRKFVLAAVVLFLWVGNAAAQFAVIDAANLKSNTWTATQATISAIENVFQSAQTVLELSPFDEMVLGSAFIDTVGTLHTILIEAEGLGYDVASIQVQIETLFAPASAPTTVAALTLRTAEVQRHLFAAQCYAMKVQALLGTITGALEHLAHLVHLVGSILGNMQGNQLVIQMQALTNQQLATQTAMDASWQRADVLKQMRSDMVTRALHHIETGRWANWPR